MSTLERGARPLPPRLQQRLDQRLWGRGGLTVPVGRPRLDQTLSESVCVCASVCDT